MTATAASAKVSSRLPNSMTPWIPISGVFTSEPSVQRGHVGQPRPEAVSRTAPPVTTRTVWPISDRTASRRIVLSTVTGSREEIRDTMREGRDAVLTVFSIPLEPTGCCEAGNRRPEQQDKNGGQVDAAVQEGIPQRLAQRAGGQEVDHRLGEGREPLGRNYDAAQGAEEDPEQVGNRECRLGPDCAGHQEAEGR